MGTQVMEITDVKIRRITEESKMRAIVSVTFDDALVVHDIKIIQGQEKLFLAMPSRKLPGGGFADIAHPTSSELRTRIEEAVLSKYQEVLSQGGHVEDTHE